MKKTIFTILVLVTKNIIGQGFPASYATWNVPTGGYTHPSTGNYGFNAGSGSSQFALNPGSQSWGVMDMDGDKKKDLVVWSISDASGYGKVCGHPSAPHWRVYLNNGTSFSSSYITWPVPSGGYVNSSYGNFGFNNSSGNGVSNLVTGNESWATMDINGDGKPDLIVTAQNDASTYSKVFGISSSPYWKVYLNTGSGFAASPTNWSVPAGGFEGASSTGNWGFNFTSGNGLSQLVQNSQTWSVTDMNGDGKPDLVVSAQNDANAYTKVFGLPSSPHWRVYLNSGSGFASSYSTWNVPTGGFEGSASTGNWGYHALGGSGYSQAVPNSQTWSTIDMDGDAKPDLVVCAQNDAGNFTKVFGLPSNTYWKVHLNTGNGFSSSPTTWNIPAGGWVSTSQGSLGFNSLGGSAIPWSNVGFQSWSTTDIDGDKKPDLLVTAQNFSPSIPTVFNNTSSPYWKVYTNTGSGFAASNINWSVPVGGYQSSQPMGFLEVSGSGVAQAQPNYQTWSTTDINGDDKADLVVYAQNDANSYSKVFGLPSSTHWRVYMNTSTVDLKENNVSSLFTVYPNPFNQKIIISGNKEKQPVLIFNALGSLIYKSSLESEIVEIDLSPLPSGIYFVKAGTSTKKIIKE
jgi:hypothetical protein